jgi:hypothetical protein
MWQKLTSWLLFKKKKVTTPERTTPTRDLAWLDQDVWTTRDGRKLSPAQMGTDHLQNTVLMLERNARIYLQAYVLQYYCAGMRPMGDGAQDAFDWEWQQLINTDPTTWIRQQTIYKALAEELQRRQG